MGTSSITSIIETLQSLMLRRGPCGEEDEIRTLCIETLRPLCDNVTIDAAGNVVGKIAGAKAEAAEVTVMAHMDELSMMVKRIRPDGCLRVEPLGGLKFGNLGQGPVEIMADSGLLPGVLSYGSLHTTEETHGVNEVYRKGNAHAWKDAYILTRLPVESLKKAGVHAGTRVVVAKRRREIFEIGDGIGGYFMDDRAGVATIIGALEILKSSGKRPAGDIYAVMTVAEEIGGQGAVFSARNLPGEIVIAIDVGPVEEEYGVSFNGGPIVAYRDSRSVYDKRISDVLMKTGRQMGLQVQAATWASYGSDASIARSYGQAARCALLCVPTVNTHGFEVIPREGVSECANLLAEFLASPTVEI